MSVTNLDIGRLKAEIESAFPLVEMPDPANLPFHGADCHACHDLVQDLEAYRGKEGGSDVIRRVHQEMSHLSAEGWAWVLPHYLRFCLTQEGQHSRAETEFLIYNLRPELRFQADTARRLALLTARQVTCLIDFLEWCLSQPYWREFFADDIAHATNFLRVLPIQK